MKKNTSQGPSCRDHGRLVLDLAQGRLNDSRSAIAERVRQECPACHSWWQGYLGGEPAAVVGGAVAEAFAGFEAPRHGHGVSSRRWLAVAAVFFALVLGLTALRQHQGARLAPGVEGGMAPVEIVEESFESGEFRLVVGGEQLAGIPPESADMIFANGFESGNFSTWSPGG